MYGETSPSEKEAKSTLAPEIPATETAPIVGAIVEPSPPVYTNVTAALPNISPVTLVSPSGSSPLDSAVNPSPPIPTAPPVVVDGEQIDAAIIEALKSPKERLYVLRLGELMEALIAERSTSKPTPRQSFPAATTYQRLLIHRCAGYYKLIPEPDTNTKAIWVAAQPESRVPSCRISELVPAEQSASGPAFKIMRRSTPDYRSRKGTSSPGGGGSVSSAASGTSSSSHGGADDDQQRTEGLTAPSGLQSRDDEYEDPILKSLGLPGNRSGGRGTDSQTKRHMTIEERTSAYNAARSRIFMDFKEEDAAAAVNGFNKDADKNALVAGAIGAATPSNPVDSSGPISLPRSLEDALPSSGKMTPWSRDENPNGTTSYASITSGSTSTEQASSSKDSTSSPPHSPLTSPMSFPTLYDARGTSPVTSTSGASPYGEHTTNGNDPPMSQPPPNHQMYPMYHPMYSPYPPPIGVPGMPAGTPYVQPYGYYPPPGNGWAAYPPGQQPSDPSMGHPTPSPIDGMNGPPNMQGVQGYGPPGQPMSNAMHNPYGYWPQGYPPPMNQFDNQNNLGQPQHSQPQQYQRTDHPPQMGYPYPAPYPNGPGQFYPPGSQSFPPQQQQQQLQPQRQLWDPNQPVQNRQTINTGNSGNLQNHNQRPSLYPVSGGNSPMGGPAARHAHSQPPPTLNRPSLFNPGSSNPSRPPSAPWPTNGHTPGGPGAPSFVGSPIGNNNARKRDGFDRGVPLRDGLERNRQTLAVSSMSSNGASNPGSPVSSGRELGVGRNGFGRSPWSYGPGLGQSGSANQFSPGAATGLTPITLGRLSVSGSVGGPSGFASEMSSPMSRHRSGSTAGSLNGSVNGRHSGTRTPLDETSSIASSSASSSSSRRTFTSTSSKHPLPPRPDWAVGMAPPPTHPPSGTARSARGGSTHRSSSSSSSSNPPHSRGHSTHQTPMITPPHVHQHPTFYPSHSQPSNDHDFPPLPGAPNLVGPYGKPLPGAPASVWNAAQRANFMAPMNHMSPPHMGSMANHNRYDDHDGAFMRPPPKSRPELFDPKASKRGAGPTSNLGPRGGIVSPNSTGMRLGSGSASPGMTLPPVVLSEEERERRERESLVASEILVEQINKLKMAASEDKAAKEAKAEAQGNGIVPPVATASASSHVQSTGVPMASGSGSNSAASAVRTAQ